MPAGEQAGMIAATAGYPPRGTFAFHAENARLIGVGIIWLQLRHLFSLDDIRQQQYRVLERKPIHHTTQIGTAKPGHYQHRLRAQKTPFLKRETALKNAELFFVTQLGWGDVWVRLLSVWETGSKIAVRQYEMTPQS